jgi:hypothetical protein
VEAELEVVFRLNDVELDGGFAGVTFYVLVEEINKVAVDRFGETSGPFCNMCLSIKLFFLHLFRIYYIKT